LTGGHLPAGRSCIDSCRRPAPRRTPASAADSPPSGRRAAFPIWRIAFYRHLDDRSASRPIIDIGAFYRVHPGRGPPTRAPRTPPPRRLDVRRRQFTVKQRRMMYAPTLIKAPSSVAINASSYLISGLSSTGGGERRTAAVETGRHRIPEMTFFS